MFIVVLVTNVIVHAVICCIVTLVCFYINKVHVILVCKLAL